MTNKEKRKFVDEICKDLHKAVLKQVDRMPDDWNGIEIREYISEYYTAHYCGVSNTVMKVDRKRSKAFRSALVALD